MTSASGIISAKTQKARMPVFVERAAEQEADIGVLLEGAAEIALRRCRRPTSRSARRRGRSAPSSRASARSRRRVSASTAKPPSSLTASCFLNLALSKTAKRTSETTAMISSHLRKPLQNELQHARSPPITLARVTAQRAAVCTGDTRRARRTRARSLHAIRSGLDPDLVELMIVRRVRRVVVHLVGGERVDRPPDRDDRTARRPAGSSRPSP